MTRAEVKTFIQTGVESLRPAVEFGRGRISEFNSIRNHTYPAAWLETRNFDGGVSTEIEGTQQLPMDNWPIRLHICMKDSTADGHAEYEDLIDQCDAIAQSLQFKYNQIVTGYKLVKLVGISRNPFVKMHADLLTGVLLTFTINTPDLTDQSENCV